MGGISRLFRRGPERDRIIDYDERERASSLLKRLLETDLSKKDRTTKVFQFVFPWALWLLCTVVSVLMLLAWKGWDVAQELLYGWVFYTVPPLGKETIIPTRVSLGVPAVMIGLTVSIIDVCFSMFLIWNYDWVKKIPILGSSLERTEAKGRERVQRSAFFRRATFIICTLVVLVPFSGSGGFGGTIFGRVLGLNPYMVLLAVLIGSLIGSTGYALLSEFLLPFMEDSWFFDLMTNLNIIQLVIIFSAIAMVYYTVKNPRMAAERTTRVVSQALDITERTLVLADDQRKRATRATMRGAKATLGTVGAMNRRFAQMNVDIATKPLDVLGPEGKRFRENTRRFTRDQVERAHRMAGGAIDTTLNMGERAASLSMDTVRSLTIDGIRETKGSVNDAGGALVKGTEQLEKAVGKRKEERRKKREKKAGRKEGKEEKHISRNE